MLETFASLLTPYTVKVGLGFLAGQCLFYVLFATDFFGLRKGGGPWSKMPGFTAHQVIVVPVLAFLTAEGLREWFVQEPATAVERLLGPRHGHLSEFVLGMMLFWDIPTGLLTPALRDLPMAVHHLGMCATAAIAMGAISGPKHQPVLGYYAPFFFGLIELSSIPLIVVDLFHPKHKAWHAFLTSDTAPSWLASLNETSRIVFAVSFFVMRTIYFPYVSMAWVLPDVMEVAALEPDERDNVSLAPLYTMASFNALFSCLQFYWGFLLMRQVLKMLRGPPADKAKES